MEKIDLSKYASDANFEYDFKKMHDDSLIDVNEDLPYPPVALSIGEVSVGQTRYPVPFGTYGNFSCIVGASKSKKTFIKSLILASYIGGNTVNYADDFKSHRESDKYILDFDTEQGKWHSQRAFKRVIQMAGGDYDMYKPFYLRKYDYKDRLKFIEDCILGSKYSDNIGFVNIDGFADLVKDVNDLVTCNALVQKLLTWTDVSQCHLTGILHGNYGSLKPTGHLGSAILKKSETVCNLEQNEIEPQYTDVKFLYTRSFQIEPFRFYIDPYGLPTVEKENVNL